MSVGYLMYYGSAYRIACVGMIDMVFFNRRVFLLTKKTSLYLSVPKMCSVDESLNNKSKNKIYFYQMLSEKQIPWPQGMVSTLLREFCCIFIEGEVYFSVPEYDFLGLVSWVIQAWRNHVYYLDSWLCLVANIKS